MVAMGFGDGKGHWLARAETGDPDGPAAGRRRQPRLGPAARTVGAVGAVAALVATLGLGACGHTKAAVPPATTVAPTTTMTAAPVVSNLMIDGVRPAVLQAPFLPQVTVTQVSCGASPKGGRFVRIDVPAGGAGTTAKSVFTKPTAVIVVPGAAVVVDPRFLTRALYAEAMKSIAVAAQGSFVLAMTNLAKAGGDGLSVQAGSVRVVGGYQCPATDVAYPGT